jgi:hypothetical protein
VSWTASSSATSWLTISATGGTGNGKFTVYAAQNTGNTSRSGIITVSTDTLTETISITQAEAGSLQLGDVNGDGVVNELDLDTLRQYLVGYDITLTAEQFIAADINRDGVVNMGDVLRLRKYIEGVIDTLD